MYVNGIPHQRLTTAATRLKQEPFYDEPYRDVPFMPKNVLIVGAGTGTDVAIALSHGVKHVDAVEIDPRLLEFGEDAQPRPCLPGPARHDATSTTAAPSCRTPTRSTT